MADVQHSNESALYDLSLFDASVQQKKVQKNLTPEPPKRSRRALKAVIYAIIAILCVVMLLSVLGNYARLTELSMEASSYLKELEKLKEEEARLLVDIDKKTTLKDIEVMATEVFGMIKIQDYQREYIDMKRNDKAEIMELSPFDNFMEKVSSAFSGIKEYLDYE